ncbi:MAG: 16S rRNA (cytosine(1402)-N(4))-methyltransferase RsmH [Phycisphaerales bacterium]|nr:16S rRNA (cytosine(1402)-N(4))-methyltransferase RsmH [Phycisphaerales bacterium]
MQLLAPGPALTAFDLTAGRGGHAELLARAVGPAGRVLLVDRDPANLAFARDRLAALHVDLRPAVETRHASFGAIERLAAGLGAGPGPAPGWAADVVLADLGFASTQMDDPARGFSFQSDGPLDMRLDPTQGETAADLVARLPEAELADAIFQLGEDPFARRIARTLVERRTRAPIATTADLAAAVVSAYGPRARQSRMHPATRTFMALRILVNDELRALDHLLSSLERGARALTPGGATPATATWLRPGARIAIIAFHSLEDRRVKHAFADWERAGLGTRLTRKPVEADESEIRANPRARSAKLRAFQIATESVAAR